ncbi:MAG: aminoacetone oxidase family FAD-binding enzyme [Oscillospiraceae bacterium]|jgi:predicted Rossmann fold flavoprotein|nr:aminoacetone oxidase family FAD-binding enzyme [Oscillospiraceae bacterium]
MERQNRTYKAAVIGGGAAGMTAAISAARAVGGENVVLIEKNEKLGRKLLATGNGRCNISNSSADPSEYSHDFHKLRFVKSVFSAVPPDCLTEFFDSLGIVLKEEKGGLLYPLGEQAAAVNDMLKLELARLGVVVLLGTKITKISQNGEGWELFSHTHSILSDKVIVACGGAAAPSLGGTDSGVQLLSELGHAVTPMSPSLVQLCTDFPNIKSLGGVRVKCKAALLCGGAFVAEEIGEVQFTDRTLSGIAVFQLSRFVREEGEGKPYRISLNLMPERSDFAVFQFLTKRVRTIPHMPLEDFLSPLFKKSVGVCLLRYSKIEKLDRPCSALSEEEIKRLAASISDWSFNITGKADFKNAQVMSGGASIENFSGSTLESKLCRGIFAAGETLDIDGPCGGYNLHWAWTSGLLAGKSAV